MVGERWDRSTSDRADLVIVNARVYSPGDGGQVRERFDEAIAVRGSKILLVGSNGEIEKLAGLGTRRIDAKGASVTPAFNDAHVHLFSGAESLQQVDLLDAPSLDEVANRIRSFAVAHPDKKVIVWARLVIWNVFRWSADASATGCDRF